MAELDEAIADNGILNVVHYGRRQQGNVHRVFSFRCLHFPWKFHVSTNTGNVP